MMSLSGLTRQSVRTPVPIWTGVFYTLNLSPISRIFLETSSEIVFIIKSVFELSDFSSSVEKKVETGTSKNVANFAIVSGDTHFCNFQYRLWMWKPSVIH